MVSHKSEIMKSESEGLSLTEMEHFPQQNQAHSHKCAQNGENMKLLLQQQQKKKEKKVASCIIIYVQLFLRYRTAHSTFGADVRQLKRNHKETNGDWHTPAA